MENMRVVFISIPEDEGAMLSSGIVENRLAACVNMIPKMQSFYWWDGKLASDNEALLVVKTTQQKIEALIDYVKEKHPYEVPEVITVPISEGLPDYINWIIEEVGKKNE